MNIHLTLLFVLWSSHQVLADSILAGDLSKLLQGPGPHPTLIDIRKTADFQRGSIPGAINIPGRVLLEKRMSFSRGVVLFSDGIADKVDVAELASQLKEAGISPVHYLHGGLPAWTQLKEVSTTHQVGAREGRGSRSITYQDLVQRKGSDTVLIDLRPDPERVVPQGHQCPVGEICKTQKFRLFPNLAAFHTAQRQKKEAREVGDIPLVVLIGAEDTSIADAELEKLFIEGYHRSTILLGGADIIAKKGLRGHKRQSGRTIEVPSENPSNPKPKTPLPSTRRNP